MGLKELMAEFAKDDSLPENPMEDAMILMGLLRDYLPIIPGDSRVHIFDSLADGYCRICGSDWECCCERQG